MLTDIAVRKASARPKPYKIADSRGLYLLVTASGSKLWRYDYRFDNKRKTLALGKYPDITLAVAREKHQIARTKIVNGDDPMVERKQERIAGETFEAVGRRWLESQRLSWAPRYYDLSVKRLETDIFPQMGDRPIGDIEPPEVLKHIRRIESRGVVETARRISNYCGSIFRFGIAEGVCTRDPSADIRDALKKKKPVKHRSAVAEKDLPAFLRSLDTYDLEEDTRDALMLVLLTVVRTQEVRFATGDEFEDLDGDEPLWRISPARMKMKRPHLVPLSRQAAELVKRRIATHPTGYLFAKDTVSDTLSENTMLYALYRMGYHSRATVHGLRGTFSTIANEREWNSDWIEMALAHDENDDVRGAYNAAKYLKQRRTMLQWWADFLDEQRAKLTD